MARETSDPRRAPSIQAYSIFPRIQQIDQMLRQDKALRRRVFEVHPEVSFTVMNGDKANTRAEESQPPRSRAGHAMSQRTFGGTRLCFGLSGGKTPLGAALDDFYDACAFAWSGARILRQEERIFPPEPGIDAKGLQVAIRA